MGLLEGKTAIITGGGNGIGRAYALLFAQEGASVVVNDIGGTREGKGRDERIAQAIAKEVKSNGGNAIADSGDVSTKEGVSQLFHTALTNFGKVDILVNNAGILRNQSFLQMNEDDWNALLSVQLGSTFLCSQAFAKQAIAKKQAGRIVNTISLSGMLGNGGQANHSAAHAAIYGLTRTTAIELQRHRITVNAIAPFAKTRMTEELPTFQDTHALTPAHVAPASLFFASHLCGDRTGYALLVAGARISAFKITETTGRFKAGNDPWSASEIAEHWNSILKP
ncbi:SDR family NAD(P)-dependent oxidoreductase [Pajaroellobacter abortibovis]|uniref:Short-chain dehydrogenase n=1 Tax=Pajaroellobacter abortibovis TaxID=1882918 RepID=A0A1L6MYV7_9BACT|nr:SDR family NAD(P)-dependent oxidoreductase [Pajaroellobacter abortibovis]APS00647.1 short-chain dehydrogenase [Pajaroellobacter abortibovis]